MRALITGATGLLGANLAIALCTEGIAVRATRRASSVVDHLAHVDLEWVDADLGDADGLARAVDGVDVVFHCAAAVGAVRHVTPALQRANVDGTAHVLDAVRRGGAGRLVHCSSTVAIGLSTDGTPCDETSPWNFADFGLADGYATTKRRAEELVQAATDVDAVIVNPGYMLGPYDRRPSSGQMILEVVRRTAPGHTPGTNCFVDVRDVARGMIAAWRAGRRGERYILGGHNLTYGEAWARIAAVAGTKPLTRAIPAPLARVAGLGGDLFERLTGREAVVNGNTVAWGCCDRFQFSSDKAIRELGYTYGPIEPAIADALAWFRAHDML